MKNIQHLTDDLYMARARKAERLATWDELIAHVETDVFLLPVKGDCLEKLGVMDGGFLLFDRTKMPLPDADDVCLCRAMHGNAGNRSTVFVKRYDGLWGSWHSVSTCRAGDGIVIQSGFFVSLIYATACACYAPGGALVWEKNLSGNPSELITKPTIKGISIGNPKEFPAIAVAI